MAEDEDLYIIPITGSCGTTPKKVDGLQSGKYQEIRIQNTHASNTLYVSFDAKLHWITITKTEHISLSGGHIKVNNVDWWVKGSGSGTTYEIILLSTIPPTKM